MADFLQANFWWVPFVALACGAQVIGQIVWIRLFPTQGLYPSILAGFICGILIISALSLWSWSDHPYGHHLANLGTYICFGYIYFHWNNMGETARRVRLVIELRAAKQGLTRAEILRRYNSGEIIGNRIHRLINGGQVEIRDGRLHLGNPSVYLMSVAVAGLKRILRVP